MGFIARNSLWNAQRKLVLSRHQGDCAVNHVRSLESNDGGHE